jgi:ABC-type Fe3+/spermidine/putrescine transport system ATPase subunit
VIRLAGVTRDFGGPVALRDVSLSIGPGEWVAILGPSGAGKTTLLRLIAGLDRPTRGDVVVEARRIGMVFQTPALWPHLRVRDHLDEVLRCDGLTPDQRLRRREELLDQFNLKDRADKFPGSLSGGEAQRLSLARAVAHEPQLLLLDEPFTGLDPLLRRDLADRIEALHRQRGLTTIHVTHHVDSTVRRAGRVVVMREGAVVQSGTLEELTRNPADPWISEFLSS